MARAIPTTKLKLAPCTSSRLLEVDGLNARWEQGVPSDWEGELGLHDIEDAYRFVPDIMNRISDRACRTGRNYESFDASGTGPGDEILDEYAENDVRARLSAGRRGVGGGVEARSGDVQPCEGDGAIAPRSVRAMSMREFRAKLIEHFDIMWQRREVQWPSRTGRAAPVVGSV